MKRRDLLKISGLAGVASVLPTGKTKAAVNEMKLAAMTNGSGVSCVIIPSETAGPYPWPTSGTGYDATLIRQDMTPATVGSTTKETGIPLTITLTIVNVNDSCNPVSGVYVSIWHCDKDGHYSEYNTTQNGGDYSTYSFFRGVQLSDSNGQVTFDTIVPGWYIPRVPHIHVQVFLNSVLSATSQMAFDDTWIEAFYEQNKSSLYTKGKSGYKVSTDQVFSDDSAAYQTLTISPTTATASSYTATMTVGIEVPTTGLINLDYETGGQFKLGQNYPNPFNSVTTIPFTLNTPSNVKIEIFDLSGRKVAEVLNQHLAPGEHKIVVGKTGNFTLSEGNYVYQLTAENSNGIFRKAKVMTVN